MVASGFGKSIGKYGTKKKGQGIKPPIRMWYKTGREFVYTGAKSRFWIYSHRIRDRKKKIQTLTSIKVLAGLQYGKNRIKYAWEMLEIENFRVGPSYECRNNTRSKLKIK